MVYIWYGFPDSTHSKVNNGRKSAILNLIELKKCRAYFPEIAQFVLSAHLLILNLKRWVIAIEVRRRRR